MTDHNHRENDDFDLRHSDKVGEKNHFGAEDDDFFEETSAELAAPISYDRGYRNVDERDRERAAAGRGVGTAALILSLISLFVLPVLFGATGIVLGLVARRRGSLSLGSWAIGIGVVSMIVGMFIVPYLI